MNEIYDKYQRKHIEIEVMSTFYIDRILNIYPDHTYDSRQMTLHDAK